MGRGAEETGMRAKERRDISCLIESVMPAFLWSAQESTDSHILSLSRLLHSPRLLSSPSRPPLSLTNCHSSSRAPVCPLFSLSVSDLSTLPVRWDYFLFLSAGWWFDTLLLLEALVYESMHACGLLWVFCVNLTWVNTAVNSANQFQDKVKNSSFFSAAGRKSRTLFYYLSISVNCP